MALATRCPHCKTTFRVASDQLKLRGGIVRCGTCNQVFDGNATLVDLDAPPAASPPPVPDIPAWLARPPAAAPAPVSESAPPSDPAPLAAPDQAVPAEPAPAADEAPIPAWLARAMDAEVKVDPVLDIAFEPIVFKRDTAEASPAAPETAPTAAAPDDTPDSTPRAKFDLIIEPDLLTDAIGAVGTPPAADAWQTAALPLADDRLPEPESAAAPQAEPDLFTVDPMVADPMVADPIVAEPALPEPDPTPVAPAAARAPAPVLDFDLSQDPDPAPVYDQSAFASPSAAVDADFAAFDDPLPVRLPRDYVLDYDLSDPPGWSAEAPPPPPPPPARPPVFEPGPDTELGPLYETEDETHYDLDLDLDQPPADELLELSVADEVEFSSADAHSQLPAAPEPEPEPEPELASELASELAPELAPTSIDAAAPEQEAAPLPEPQADLDAGPLPLLRASAAPDPGAEEAASLPIAPARVPEPEADADEPEFVRRAREKELASRRRTIVYGVGSVLLALLVLGQSIYSFRDLLAARYPGLKPALVASCALLRCKVELPAQLEALKIEAPELQSLGNNTFVLTTLVRNESALVQAWPFIHLELTDSNEKPLVRRVFTPAQYLPATVAPAKGFGAMSEQSVKIHFELKQLKASGYHVAVFYP